MSPQELVQQAIALFNDGFSDTNSDKPGIVSRWACQSPSGEYEEKEIPIEIWMWMRGVIFGLGEMVIRQRERESNGTH